MWSYFFFDSFFFAFSLLGYFKKHSQLEQKLADAGECESQDVHKIRKPAPSFNGRYKKKKKYMYG